MKYSGDKEQVPVTFNVFTFKDKSLKDFKLQFGKEINFLTKLPLAFSLISRNSKILTCL